jgi:hypothetical protein
MAELTAPLRLHDQFRHEVVLVGLERAPVLVVDNLFSEPQALIDCAASSARFATDPRSFYPGPRAPMPAAYGSALRTLLGPLIGEAFGLASTDVVRDKCDFSIVTTPPDRLHVLQRMPHIDNTDPKHFALLHYLCGPGYGGTSFYRHRGTGFETVDEARFPIYRAAVQQELASRGPPPARYLNGDSEMFERIASFEGRFNRLLVYRGRGLHCADIAPGFRGDSDPRTGRLTANAFFYFR